MKNRHIRYRLDRKCFFGKAAMLCLFLSIVFRGVGGLLNPTIFLDRFDTLEFALPILCSLLYLLCILFFGKRWFKSTIVPFVLGVMACVVRLFSFDNLMQQQFTMQRILISICFYLVLTAVYSAVVFSGLRVKMLLFVLFLVPLCYHAAFEILPVFRNGVLVNAYVVLMELSVLAVLFAMLFVSLGMSSKPMVKEVNPESGKTVTPPIPGDKLDSKPPVGSEEMPKTSDSAKKEESPDTAESSTTDEKIKEGQFHSGKAEAGLTTEGDSSVMKKEEDQFTHPEGEEENTEYDPFAPSSGPIQLTLNPVLDDNSSEGKDA